MNSVSKVSRFVGIFIDGLVASVPMILFSVLAGVLDMPLLAMIGYIPYLVLYLFRDALFGGQSIGKKVMKYRVVKEDGSSLAGDYKTALIRNISLLIPFVDQIMVLTDKPRLGDNWAKTQVIAE